MISTHPLRRGGGAADYYLQRESCDDLGYYLHPEEIPGSWAGRGAAHLHLDGRLTDRSSKVLRELLVGRLPDGTLAGAPVWRQDPKTGQRHDIRVPGFDVTFSAPKSVSVVYALGGPQVAGQVLAAHRLAVDQSLAVLEQLAARAARGHQGDGQRAKRIATHGMVAAAFDHDTSRAGDPQLHTHVVIANLTQGIDGRWSALDSQTLHRQATTCSHLCQVVLRGELTERLGLTWSEVSRGIAEVVGIDEPLRRGFSRRRAQIEAALEQVDSTGPAAAQLACLQTRPAKTHEDPASLRSEWAQRAVELGTTPDDIAAVLTRRVVPDAVDEQAIADRVLAADGLTLERALFDQGALVRALCQELPAGAHVTAAQVLGMAGRVLGDDRVVPFVHDRGRAFTTVEMLATEQAALDLAAGCSVGAPVPVVPRLDGLREDQAELVRVLLASPRGVRVVSGPAGCGKTHALSAATDAWQRAGLEVRGAAVAAIAADNLRSATGVESVSIARLLSQPAEHVPRGGVLLIDEAGMVGTRTLHRLLELTRDRGCQVVLIGDPAQLPELEAGGLFAALVRQSSALHLDGHHRQQVAWERSALDDLRAGRTTHAIDAYAQQGRTRHAAALELSEQVAADYLAHSSTGSEVVVLASTRERVAQLNRHVRNHLMANGRLGSEVVRVGSLELRVGDQVVTTRNVYPAQLLNGARGTITAVGSSSVTMTRPDGREHCIGVELLQSGLVEHGYALTLHRAQGATVDVALLWADPDLYREALYVGLSRARAETHLYLPAGAPTDDHVCGARQHDRGIGRTRFDHSHAQQLAGEARAM